MEFYPPKYWGLDPIYYACVKLTIADVLTLTEHPTCKGKFRQLDMLICTTQSMYVLCFKGFKFHECSAILWICHFAILKVHVPKSFYAP